MKFLPLLIIIAFGISGCDNAKQDAIKAVQNASNQTATTLMIAPGYKVNIDGHPVPISGTDDCQLTAKNGVSLGDTEGQTSRSCIVIKPDTKAVQVQVGLASGSVSERWTVVHSGESTLLQRADGSYVEYARD